MRRAPTLFDALLAGLACLVAGCGPSPPSSSSLPPHVAAAPAFEGRYAHGSLRLDIARRGDGYWLDIRDDGPTACAFSAPAIRLDNRLLASLQDWKSGAVLTVRPADDGVDVLSEQEDDHFSLAYFCRGGASLSGTYRPAGDTATL
ncbi:hypothetical protein RKE25_15745 [Dyella sp. BiH032]|uniref:hypothetical protein n=1 Tax=Dyella sp. BiH032 TaxID=3075430 RepID=UPI002892EB20|nr:hypothetical protein [Dyella sp. BiH032]WNL44862.1 hypothetical protein RKE25_15745 [Dyella sp. BiH032]